MTNKPPKTVFLDQWNYRLGGGHELFMILGPCVIESEALCLEVAEEVLRVGRLTGMPVLFKSSFDKANRTSVDSFRGPGMNEGLRILSRVREEIGLPIISDIHTPDQAPSAGEVLDAIQIPAFLCRQTDLLVAAGRTGKVVNIKKGQYQSPEDMKYPAQKVVSSGNDNVLLTERGTSFGYRDLVVDMRSIMRMQEHGFPVVIDATHASQTPGGQEGKSGGDRTLVPGLARAAVAAGADGVFMETHPNPDKARCDGPNSLALQDLERVAKELQEIFKLVRRGPFEDDVKGIRSAHEIRMEVPLEERLKKIRLIIFDVDGILTDGRITMGGADLEIKSFDVRDGHGIKLAKRFGLEIAIITGRISDVVPRRANELGIELVYQKIWDKKVVLDELLQKLNLKAEEVAVIGDDIVDIPLFTRVGLGVTVPEAPLEVRRKADMITTRAGGRGAARELVEKILKARGDWDRAMQRYYD
jgi:2-dehydro-3-deoxyphosphooctonate aldolase (KDO 8-P synthase)